VAQQSYDDMTIGELDGAFEDPAELSTSEERFADMLREIDDFSELFAFSGEGRPAC
jgi:hypothetical protein